MRLLKFLNKMDKKGFEMNFAWIFGILVGAIILGIALYATTSLIGTESKVSETEIAMQLGILLNPLETGLEEASYATISLPVETQVINRCRTHGNFGKQIIVTNARTGIGDLGEEGEEVSFFNKYIFSQEIEEGKKLHLIVKPLEMPYKISDMFFVSARNYCFVNSPNEIEEEIDDLNPLHVALVDSLEECSQESESVCFGNSEGCDIDVNEAGKFVTKDGKTVYYEGSLIYGAIFSDPEIYECQVERLMKRNAELAYLYAEKSNFLGGKGCSSNLGPELLSFASLLQFSETDNSLKLQGISDAAKNLRRRNEKLECELF